MTKLALTRDINGYNTFGLADSSNKKNFILTSAGGELTTTAPASNTSGYLAVYSFEPGAKVWVALGGTAIEMPVNNTVNTTNAELNPTARNVPAGATLRFKTNDTSAEVGVAFYELS